MRRSSTVRAPFRAALPAALATVVALSGAALVPASVGAQQAEHAMLDPLVPRGRIQLQLTPTFSLWDHRYGLSPTGGTEVQPLGVDLTDPNGTAPFSGMSTLEASLAALTGQSGFTPNLGSLDGVVTKSSTRVEAGARLGVFDWLTLGAMVPYVKTRTAIDIAFRPDSANANLGVSPAVTNGNAVNDLLGAIGDAQNAAQTNADDACSGGSDAACAAAQDLLQRVTAFANNLRQAYFSTPFFPRAGTPTADALAAGLASLDSDLTAAGLSAVGRSMVFATDVVDEGTFKGLMTNSAAGLQGSPLETMDGLWTLGDVELTADVRLLQGEVRDSAALDPRFAWSLTGGVLVRLGTGKTTDPNVFLDVGSGDGQTDFEGHVAGSLLVGSHLGLWGGFRYGKQRATTLVRRVAPPDQILAPVVSSRLVKWAPGSYTDLQISPRLRITSALAISVDYRRFHKGADSYALTSDVLQDVYPVDASVLDQQTEVSLSEAAFGLRYNTAALLREGRDVTPFELGLRVVRPLSGAGGQVPKATRVQVTLSFFHRLWGHVAAQPKAPPTPPAKPAR